MSSFTDDKDRPLSVLHSGPPSTLMIDTSEYGGASTQPVIDLETHVRTSPDIVSLLVKAARYVHDYLPADQIAVSSSLECPRIDCIKTSEPYSMAYLRYFANGEDSIGRPGIRIPDEDIPLCRILALATCVPNAVSLKPEDETSVGPREHLSHVIQILDGGCAGDYDDDDDETGNETETHMDRNLLSAFVKDARAGGPSLSIVCLSRDTLKESETYLQSLLNASMEELTGQEIALVLGPNTFTDRHDPELTRVIDRMNNALGARIGRTCPSGRETKGTLHLLNDQSEIGAACRMGVRAHQQASQHLTEYYGDQVV